MNIFRDLERAIDEKLRGLFDAPSQRRELIEIQRAILDEIADRAQVLPRARRVLSSNDVRIRIAAPQEDQRTACRLIFIDGDALENEIKAHLRRESIEFPPDLQVTVEVEAVSDLAGRPFHVVYGTKTAEASPAAKRVRFILQDGSAVEVSKPRIHIGRTAEVLDDRRRLARRNDVTVDEQTVSRAHAHMDYDSAIGDFRLFDDGSTYGTSVLHRGRLVEVPKAGGRGQRLESGDEIYFGQARARFEVL
jgi:hypothetical protein